MRKIVSLFAATLAGGMLSDLHGSAAYRANLVKVMAKRAVMSSDGVVESTDVR